MPPCVPHVRSPETSGSTSHPPVVTPRVDTRGVLHRLRLQLSRLRASLSRRPTVEPPRRRWHSVSSCSEYERCPRRYRYGYVDRLREDRPVPASWRYGSVVHTALEAAYRARADGVPLAWATPVAIDAFHAAWIDEAMPDDPDWLARGEELVRSVLANDRLATDEILGVEHCFKYETDGGRQFVGFADLVVRRDPTTVEIIDHKVTRVRARRGVAPRGSAAQPVRLVRTPRVAVGDPGARDAPLPNPRSDRDRRARPRRDGLDLRSPRRDR